MNTEVAELYQPLFLYIKKRVNSVEDAEDITQEVFLKLSKSMDKNIRNIKSWVYSIAKNTITDYYRKKKILASEVDDEKLGYQQTEEESDIDLSNCITFYLNKLPEDYSTILTLSEIKEIPQKEIAENLGINYVTLRSKIQRGRKKLKKLFSECCTITQGGKGSILEIQQNGNSSNDDSCS